MREQLNSNPLVQLAVLGALLIGVAIFLMSSGGEEEESPSAGATEATVSVAGTDASGSATAATPGEAVEGAVEAAGESLSSALSATGQTSTVAPPPPRPVLDAWKANRTLVLLFVRDGGIDDRLVHESVGKLDAIGGVTTFVVPTKQLVRYVSIAQGVDLSRVPALVVIRPENLSHQYNPASVQYGFQSGQSVVQAVVDARYHGGTLPYHP